MNYGYVILGVVFVFAIFASISVVDQITGDFSYGGVGRGSYAVGNGLVQFQPKEACEYHNLKSLDPPEVYLNNMGQWMTICYKYSIGNENDRTVVPLIQWLEVEPFPNQKKIYY